MRAIGTKPARERSSRPYPVAAALELEAEHGRAARACSSSVTVVRLSEVHDAPVVAEDVLCKLGMAVEAEWARDERIEVPDEKVGEVEGARAPLN